MTSERPDKKVLRRRYKETARLAGVFAVHNVTEGVSLVGTSPDVPSMLNRQRFQLEMGVHPHKRLQDDWDRLGTEAFAFEMLDRLELETDSDRNLKEELSTLLDLWSTKLVSEGTRLYNEQKGVG